MRWHLALGLFALSSACSSACGSGGSNDTGNPPVGAADAGGSVVFAGDGGSVNLGTSDAAGTTTNCASGAGSFIYVISDENDLYTFDPTQFPSAGAFSLVGNVACDMSGVNSMAVDRSATAWVNFNDGKIFQVTTTAPITCTPTTFAAGQGGFSNALGMGFSVDSSGSNDETFYVSDNGGPGGDCNASSPSSGCMGKGLGTIDTTTMILTPLGPYTGALPATTPSSPGPAKGTFSGSSPPPPDRTARSTRRPARRASPTSLPTVNAANGGYAFSFWGGDFYFYTAPSNETKVTHLETSTGTTTTSPELSFTIVGAGVSTCAPTAPPK